MQISNLYKIRIFNKIEDVCCQCVCETIGGDIDREYFYSIRKPALGMAIARGIAFVIMHDMYAMTYKEIADRAKMGEKSVMMRVRIIREYISNDALYSKIYNIIKERL